MDIKKVLHTIFRRIIAISVKDIKIRRIIILDAQYVQKLISAVDIFSVMSANIIFATVAM